MPTGHTQRSLLSPLLASLVFASCTCGPCAKSGGTGKGIPDYAALLKGQPRAKVSRPQALIPSAVLGAERKDAATIVATSDAKGSWDAFIATDLGKALREGGAIEHLALSSQIESALSLGHELASASKYPLAADKLADALVGPAAIAVTGSALPRFVAVKEIDSSQEALVRLALMAAALRTDGDSVTEEYGEARISKLKRNGKPIWVVAFQNVLIASNDVELARAAVDLATSKSTDSVESIVAFKEESGSLKGAQAAVLLNLAGGELMTTLTDLNAVVLRLELAPAVLKIRGTLNAAAEHVAAFNALSTVPQDVAFFTSLGAASPKRVLARLREDAAALQIPAALSATLSEESFYALTFVEAGQPNHLVGLGLKDGAAAAKALPLAAKGWIDKPEPMQFADGVSGFCHPSKSLCVAVTKDFLLASNDEETLKAAIETGLGKRPALFDVKGFGQVAKTGDKRYLTTFLNTARAAQAAAAFFTAVAERSEQSFDVADVDETVGPLFKALGALPPVGGALEATGTVIAGELRPLPAQ